MPLGLSALAVALGVGTAGPEPAPIGASDPPAGAFALRSVPTEVGGEPTNPFNLAQAPDGALWIGTNDGVLRREGTHLEHFGDLPSLLVRQVLVGPDGRVWVRHLRGVSFFDGTRFVTPAAEGVNLDAPEALAVDAAGTVWVGTPEGLARRDPAGAFVREAAVEGRVPSLFALADGGLLAGTRGAVWERTPDGRWLRMGPDFGVPDEPIVAVARDAQGQTWLSTPTRTLRRPADAARFVDTSLPQGLNNFFSVDRSRTLWIGNGRGLYRTTPDGDVERLDGTEGISTQCLTEDREGNDWLATSRGLLRFWGPTLWRWHLPRHGLPAGTVWSVARVSGSLWVGTESGLAHAAGGQWRADLEAGAEPVRSIAPATGGRLWLAGPSGHIVRWDPATGARRVFGRESGIPAAMTWTLLPARDGGEGTEGSEGTLWLSTAEAGLFRGEARDDSVRFAPEPLDEGPTPPRTRDLVQDGLGRIWVPTERGLFVREAGRWTRLGVADGLAQDATRFVVSRRDGSFCVAYGASSGLSCFAYDAGRMTRVVHHDRAHGLVSDVVYLLGEDALGRLWVGTNRGADVIVGQDIVHFGTDDGLADNDFSGRAFVAEPNGDVWLGAGNGLAFVRASEPLRNPPPPTVTVRARFGTGSATERLADGASLPFERRALAIELFSPSLRHESAIEYQARTVGLGPDWQPTPSGTVHFAELGPGSYTFEARARYPGEAFGPVASVRFHVLPPLWRKPASLVTMALALLATIAALVRWRGASSRRRTAALESLVEQRTGELRAAQASAAQSEKLAALGRMLAQLSHEMNNPLNVVVSNIGPVRDYVQELGQLLGGSDRMTPEARFMVDDGVEALRSMDEAAGRMNRIQEDLRLFLTSGRARAQALYDVGPVVRTAADFARRSAPASLTLHTEVEPALLVVGDAGALGQVLLNLLQNASDALQGQGNVWLRARSDGARVVIEVEDDGPGVPDALADRIFEPFFTTKPVGQGTGLGLAICRQIVIDMHGGDLTLERSAARGARFRIELPVAPTPEARA